MAIMTVYRENGILPTNPVLGQRLSQHTIFAGFLAVAKDRVAESADRTFLRINVEKAVVDGLNPVVGRDHRDDLRDTVEYGLYMLPLVLKFAVEFAQFPHLDLDFPEKSQFGVSQSDQIFDAWFGFHHQLASQICIMSSAVAGRGLVTRQAS